MEPRQHAFVSQRLTINYVVWGAESNPPVLLIQGGRDHARNWDFVAARLLVRYCVYAVDLRGHGDSDWAIGGPYSMIDHVADIAAFFDHVDREPMRVVGHSLGGGIALQVAGVLPERVERICAVEGLGPGISRPRPAHLRMREWLASVRSLEQRRPRHYANLDDAVARMREANPHLTPEMAQHLTEHGVRANPDGTLTWKFDNYVHTHSPYEFNMADAREIWNQIRCPILLVRGDESHARDPEEDGTLSAFHQVRSIQIKDAGHWVHHDQLDAFMAELLPFLNAPA
jgi:pimeloyl-ACP methyl ester carboxylesterase